MDTKLDLRGLNCPLPAMKTERALRHMRPGETLIVQATDPMSAIDIPHHLNQNGHTLRAHRREEGVLIFEIERGQDVEPSRDG